MEIDDGPDGFSGRERERVEASKQASGSKRSTARPKDTRCCADASFTDQAKRKSLLEKFAALRVPLGSSSKMEKALPEES